MPSQTLKFLLLQQFLRIATPLVALLTSSFIYLMVPYMVSLPTPCQLQQLNQELQEHKDNLHKEVAQRTHELLQEKAKWKMVAEQSPQILWLKDTKGVTEYYNNKWYAGVGLTQISHAADRYQYTGLPHEEKNPCGRAIHPVDRELMQQKWVEGRNSEKVSDYKIRIKVKALTKSTFDSQSTKH